ncbi:helix-turn-helix transcriptional regulator [Microbacterium sp. 13-71-7]|uniref:helix-turn-helix transcriptional regulator n=1 Tax=Microbacterium sp. 13-71-7 TaxID=1970399 RepID=UPI00344DBC3F
MRLLSHEAEPHCGAVQSLAQLLRRRRTSAGLSQEEVALAAGLALHTYSSLERGETAVGTLANPTFSTMFRVFRVLDIEVVLT